MKVTGVLNLNNNAKPKEKTLRSKKRQAQNARQSYCANAKHLLQLRSASTAA